MAAFMTRRARLRRTAQPTFLVAVRPTRVCLARVLSTYSTRAWSTYALPRA